MPTTTRRRTATRYVDPIERYIRDYKKLPARVKIGCRIVEAKMLIEVVQTVGDYNQKNKVNRLLNGKHGICLECLCRDDDCNWRLNGRCRCVENVNLCGTVRAWAVDSRDSGRRIFGGRA